MPLLTNRDIEQLKAAMEELAPFIEEPAIYRRRTGETSGDPVRGIPSQPQYESTDITLQVRPLTLEEVMVSGGAYVMGDVEFTVRNAPSGLTEVEAVPDHPDRIIWQGDAYRPKSVTRLWLGEVLWWTIRAGKV